MHRKSCETHPFWAITVCVVAAVSFGLYAWYYSQFHSRPGFPRGSSLPGIVFGGLGLLAIVFEFLLWPRKRLRAWRIGSARCWMLAHIYVGLLSVVFVILHSGPRLGGALSTLLVVVFASVIVSGIYGLVMQAWLPRKMTNEVRHETVYENIDVVVRRFCLDARQLVNATCGLGAVVAEEPHQEQPAVAERETMTVGMPRVLGNLDGTNWRDKIPPRPLEGNQQLDQETAQLASEFDANIEDFLHVGPALHKGPLRTRESAANYFHELKAQVPNAAGVVDTLEKWCEIRRQLADQQRIHGWLHGWIPIHLGLSAALLFLLVWHIWDGLKYW